MSSNVIDKYSHDGQLYPLIIGAKNFTGIAPRAYGKSEGWDAPILLRNVQEMPRSAGGLLSPAYSKLIQNTLPAVFTSLDRLGYKRDIHYMVGKKPPAKWNWPKPIIDPIHYDYVIAWCNGSIDNMLSFDRSMSANSMSLDYIFGFEAKYLDYKKIVDEVLPAVRGNRQYFGDCPWHHGQTYTTDMPLLKMGSWVFEQKKKMDEELISLIDAMYKDLVKFDAKKDKIDLTYFRQQFNRKLRELDRFRKEATLYYEADPFDNIELLGGESYFAEKKRDLPNLIFNTSILNIRPRRKENGFYSGLSDKLHYYESANHHYLESLDYSFNPDTTKVDCRHDGDIVDNLPLIIAMDYNAAINTMVVGQVRDNKLYVLKHLFVKTPRKIRDVVNDFCDYYHYRNNRDVTFVFDSTSIYDTPQDTTSFADTVLDVLTKRGFRVKQCYIGQPVRHDKKHNWIDEALKGSPKYLFPLFNKNNCEYLLAAMENTGINVGRNGFEKDKSDEKKPDTPENPDELKTHATDAFDTLFIGCNFYGAGKAGAAAPSTHF